MSVFCVSQVCSRNYGHVSNLDYLVMFLHSSISRTENARVGIPQFHRSPSPCSNKVCARTARLQWRLERELLWYWHFYWSESSKTVSLNNGQRGCMIFSSFLYLPSENRQESELGNRLQLAGFNCTDEPSLGVTWTWQRAEKENFFPQWWCPKQVLDICHLYQDHSDSICLLHFMGKALVFCVGGNRNLGHVHNVNKFG